MEKEIAKTRLGVVSFDSIFKSLRYVPWKFLPQQGSWLQKDKETEAFLSIRAGTRDFGPQAGSFTSFNSQGHGLVAAPVDPKLLYWTDFFQIGSFQISSWRHVGLCLVTINSPPGFVGSERLAFVPIDEVIQALQKVNPHATQRHTNP